MTAATQPDKLSQELEKLRQLVAELRPEVVRPPRPTLTLIRGGRDDA